MAADTVFWGFLAATAALALSSLLTVVLNGFDLPPWLGGHRRWYALVVLVLATAGLGVYTGVMDAGRAGLEVSDHSVPPGRSAHATGRGYEPREDIRLLLSLTAGGQLKTIPLGEATADSRGRFELTFGVPISAVGAERLSAVGGASGHSESTDFSVPALVPSIELSPTTGAGGVEVDVSGGQFFPGETVELRAGRRVTAVTAGQDGTFSVTVRLPGDKGSEPGTEITITARGRTTGDPFGNATGTYVVSDPAPTRTSSVTPRTTEPAGPSGPTTSETNEPSQSSQQEPPPDPSMPRSYRGTWTGEDTSDASLTTSIQLSLTGGEVGAVIGRSSYAASLSYTGTVRLMEVGSNYIIVRETLDPPSTGVTDILLGARSRNTLDYQTDRRAVVLARE
jgi:hypothetical protein